MDMVADCNTDLFPTHLDRIIYFLLQQTGKPVSFIYLITIMNDLMLGRL